MTNEVNATRQKRPLERIVLRALDWLWPWCPSGMDHRVRSSVVTNAYGHRYCWHRDCMKANFAEVKHEAQNEPVQPASFRGTNDEQ